MRLHVGRDDIPKWGIQLNPRDKPGIPLRLPLQTCQHPPFLVGGEFSDIAVENCSKRVARYDLPTAELAMGRKPGGETAQFRHNDAVIAPSSGPGRAPNGRPLPMRPDRYRAPRNSAICRWAGAARRSVGTHSNTRVLSMRRRRIFRSSPGYRFQSPGNRDRFRPRHPVYPAPPVSSCSAQRRPAASIRRGISKQSRFASRCVTVELAKQCLAGQDRMFSTGFRAKYHPP